MVQDGMDQAKWALPRYKHVRATKSTQMIQRPKCKVHATWLHGVALYIWVVDPRVPSDASMVMEAGARSIEYAVEACRKHGQRIPTELIIWDTLQQHFSTVPKPWYLFVTNTCMCFC